MIGTHVKDVYEEVTKLVSLQSSGTSDPGEKRTGSAVIDFVAGTFQPIIPALSGAGMVKAVLALLIVFDVITAANLLHAESFCRWCFLLLTNDPGLTVAQKLRCNPILAASVGYDDAS